MTQVASYVCGESGNLDQLDKALWHTRYTVLLQLRHWKLRSKDVWTVEPAEPAEAECQRHIDALAQHGAIGFQT